ncbi:MULTISPECIES: SDR family oxidoreductase [unclassified Mycolicibacterium]|uniref:SDR family oxidoreductase n=1 Tax=unclassified Mycolicibacterium TaxID=2636767 RepID=UPI0012DC4A74|nr:MULTISPECIES: SDR family oxidoreductase [unclassified Mycolicibacterium]MUL82237.1 SDR family oxidoreductase [Mycolicibacterium sp. CBMA 329]MUL88003.1 SDR family oxidoreductase [Mycolicibacterium sp. CBMA 331]MUM02333.1 SDR family oxidoreductase [Mycolicibacterium sp. CBMA 334]MUM26354.1 SDR family oxidoreductase [Mycolicibacterium sp. CBMA 295]MUM38300.1 SDR family oxidoreductase [Mycolicibacterium sp. CBMA 247]
MTARTIVVTGGATGIGYGIAQRLVGDGDDVVLVSRNPDKLAAAAQSLAAGPGNVTVYPLDVRDHEAMSEMIEALPRVDGLVNNAAGNFTARTVDMSFRAFRSVVEISLYGTFNASQALAKRLIRENKPGSILNIVASYGWTGAPLVAHSAAAKAGMIAFTKSVAREWGPDNIRVNALAPGFVPTDNAVAGILSSAQAQQRMLDLIPLGRFGNPEEIAEVAVFLLGDGARYVTGAVLAADGGRSLGISMHDAVSEHPATTPSAHSQQLIPSAAGRGS